MTSTANPNEVNFVTNTSQQSAYQLIQYQCYYAYNKKLTILEHIDTVFQKYTRLYP